MIQNIEDFSQHLMMLQVVRVFDQSLETKVVHCPDKYTLEMMKRLEKVDLTCLYLQQSLPRCDTFFSCLLALGFLSSAAVCSFCCIGLNRTISCSKEIELIGNYFRTSNQNQLDSNMMILKFKVVY